jgi:triosephosphate isomerase
MNGSVATARMLAMAIVEELDRDHALLERCDFLICPPFVHLGVVRQVLDHKNAPLWLGGQDCSERENGAFTGDISAAMLRDCGMKAVILGHSERRQFHGEPDSLIAAKAAGAHKAGLMAVICVGELEAEREAGRHFDVVERQLRESMPSSANPENTTIAYEPVWAIGTGKTATPDDIAAMHEFIRGKAGACRILYGGSVKPDNAAALFKTDNVDGALIGGASLKADQYLAIAKAVG